MIKRIYILYLAKRIESPYSRVPNNLLHYIYIRIASGKYQRVVLYRWLTNYIYAYKTFFVMNKFFPADAVYYYYYLLVIIVTAYICLQKKK